MKHYNIVFLFFALITSVYLWYTMRDVDSVYKDWRHEYEASVATSSKVIGAIHPFLDPNHSTITKLSSYSRILQSSDSDVDSMILFHLRPSAYRMRDAIVPGDDFLAFAYCTRNGLNADALLKSAGKEGNYYELSFLLCSLYDKDFVPKNRLK